jgi:shikimate kinase
MTKKRIWVIGGAPFSGKSTVGKILAKALECPFEDLDEQVEREAGIPIPCLFSIHGERHFRRIESLCLKRILGGQGPLVLALGGGSLLKRANLKAVLENGVLFTLTADDCELVSRFAPGRPLTGNTDELRNLLSRRRSHYLGLPGAVDTRGRSPLETARIITELIETLMSP